MLRYGYIGDGVFKMLVAAALIIWQPVLADFFLSPQWLIIAATVMLFLSGATEISYGARTGASSHIKYLLGYDALWILATILGIILATMGNVAGGYIWFGFILVGSIGIAFVFTTSADQQPNDGNEQLSD